MKLEFGINCDYLLDLIKASSLLREGLKSLKKNE